MDKKRGLKNVIGSVVFRVVIVIVDIFLRRFLIRYVGNEANGLNSLYSSILDFLSIAELGVGTAITYCMYRPIVEGDRDKTAALYILFRNLYLIIGGIILVAGCAVMPLLPTLAKDYETANVDLYLTFALMLVSVLITYLYSAKSSLIIAHKDDYITNTISSTGQLLQSGVQLLVLYFTRSFVWYLVCRIAARILQWVATEIAARVMHGDILKIKSSIDGETKKEVVKNIRALFMHRIGGILVNTADSIIISSFIGIVILGKYSNYTAIVVAMSAVLGLCFTPLTSVIGHMFVEEGKETAWKYCHFFHTLNFILGAIFFLGYYAVVDSLVAILFGNDLELSYAIPIVITVDYFIQFMRQAVSLFRDATGTFYYDRWKPLAEGLVNIALSVLFVCVFPEDYRVVGVIVATIITNVFICHVIEPYVLYKHAFRSSVKGYWLRNYVYIAAFAGAVFLMHVCSVRCDFAWAELFINGAISLAISLPVCAAAALSDRDFRYCLRAFFRRRKHRSA